MLILNILDTMTKAFELDWKVPVDPSLLKGSFLCRFYSKRFYHIISKKDNKKGEFNHNPWLLPAKFKGLPENHTILFKNIYVKYEVNLSDEWKNYLSYICKRNCLWVDNLDCHFSPFACEFFALFLPFFVLTLFLAFSFLKKSNSQQLIQKIKRLITQK